MSLRDAIHDEISKGTYECIVCFENITPYTPIWSCKSCSRVFDSKCINKCVRNTSIATVDFNCPHCSIPQLKKGSTTWKCWCRKMFRPKPHRKIPHSCGRKCGVKRKCGHPCPLVCHAGPHECTSVCSQLVNNVQCYCGSNLKSMPCSEINDGGFSCGGVCNRKDDVCGHVCLKKCHPRNSEVSDNIHGNCERNILVSCYCNRLATFTAKCGSMGSLQRAGLQENGDVVKISCGKKCDALLSCEVHRCERLCHENDGPEIHSCPLQPYVNETCYCGKVKANRESCLSPKVTCGQRCLRELECGHSCQELCHQGSCGPCGVMLEGISCRCGLEALEGICGNVRSSKPACDRKCGSFLSCGRHKCQRKCCQFNPKTMKPLLERRAQLRNRHNSLKPSFKKARYRDISKIQASNLSSNQHKQVDKVEINEESELEAIRILIEESSIIHNCENPCGKLLSCKTHSCERPCHNGPCGPCYMATFDDWSCPCGKTRLSAPIRCGTVIPKCTGKCHRPQDCGHTATHLCHSDDEDCASCAVYLKKPCRCGKANILSRCTNDNVICQKPCLKKLGCGHVCQNICCPGGEAHKICKSKCNYKYPCGHLHNSICHHSNKCPEACITQCRTSCHCGNLSVLHLCGESPEVKCNDDCVRESFPPELLKYYEHESLWLSRIESKIRNFISNETKKTLWFQPMHRQHRRMVYYLLEKYGMTGHSVDEGPMRSICGMRTDDTYLCKFTLKSAPRVRPQIEVITDRADKAENSEEPMDVPTFEDDNNYNLKLDVDKSESGETLVPFSEFENLRVDDKIEAPSLSYFKPRNQSANKQISETDRLKNQIKERMYKFDFLENN